MDHLAFSTELQAMGRSGSVVDRFGACPRDDTTAFKTSGRTVGFYRRGWFHKRVNTEKHQLRKPPAWAIDAAHLDQLRGMSAQGVKLHDETGRSWTATLDVFRRHGFPVNRRFGVQVGLAVRHWAVDAGEANEVRR